MSLRQNQASQYVLIFAENTANQTGRTGDAGNITMQIGLAGVGLVAATNAVVELSAANAPGYYRLELTAAETNAVSVLIVGASTTASTHIHGRELQTFLWAYDGITFDNVMTHVMAALFGVAERTGTGVIFNRRDGTTDSVTVVHDSLGNRTVSTLS